MYETMESAWADDEMEEEITKGSLIVHQGKAVHPSVLNN